MKKILLTFMLLVLALSLLTLPVFGEALPEDAQIQTETETVTTPPADGNDTTVSGILLAFFEQNGDDICQYLSLFISILLAWLFKKGVLPSLSGSMGHISNTLDGGISALLEEGKNLSKNTEESIHTFIETVTPTLEMIGQVTENAEKTDLSVATLKQELEKASLDRAQTKAVLKAQMELFYQFFMAVNLPQYQKDRLGECYTRLLTSVEAEHDTKA